MTTTIATITQIPVIPVWMIDAPIHTEANNFFCGDPTCPCAEDAAQIVESHLVASDEIEDCIEDDDYPSEEQIDAMASDPECPCKEDETLNRMFLTKPLDAGLLTNSEAIRLYFGTQLVPTQDELITDELTDDEPLITDRRNEWNGYNQEMAWEAAEEQWRRATDSRDFEPDDLLHTDEHPYCDDPTCWCHLCEQEVPFTDEEIEVIMSAAADNQDADELEQDKHDWLSEHL